MEKNTVPNETRKTSTGTSSVMSEERQRFRKRFEEKILLLDGASGTQMMKRGMPAGVCPELWAIEHPDALLSMQRAYVAAGSEVVYTFTFGGSRFKLGDYGLADRTLEINTSLARLSREAVGPDILVGGDLAPSGRMILPYGDTAFEDVVAGFKEQVLGLLEGGVDFFAVETMMDLQEARAAILAVRELCDLPILATMTFESGMRTLSGTDPVSALITLQSLGADAVGTNCSTGPAEMVEVVRAMKPHATVPIVAKPNAGKPKLVDGKTAFDMDAETYATFIDELVIAGVNALGGCCGTDPGYIVKLADGVRGKTPMLPLSETGQMICSARRAVRLDAQDPFPVMGKLPDPMEDETFRQILLDMDMDEVFDLARDQLDEGATLLSVSAGAPGIDEMGVLPELVQTVAQATALPLRLTTASPETLEAVLRTYAGRAMVHPLSDAPDVRAQLLAVAERYGALVDVT